MDNCIHKQFEVHGSLALLDKSAIFTALEVGIKSQSISSHYYFFLSVYSNWQAEFEYLNV